MTLGWWGTMIAAPTAVAAWSLRRGKRAMDEGDFDRADLHLRRALRHPEVADRALCLLAENALRASRPGAALDALEDVDARQLPAGRRSCVRLLGGIALMMLGRADHAQRTLARLADAPDSSVEARLAMAQACLLAGDLPAARVYLAMVKAREVVGEVAARRQLCVAALLWREGRGDEALATLPPAEACAPEDGAVVRALLEKTRAQLAH